MQNADQIRTAPDGDILVAPKGSAFPDEISEAFTGFGPEWDVLGLTDDNGVELTPSKSTGEIKVWQSASPGKYYIEGAGFTVGYNLAQFNAPVLRHFWGTEWTVTAGNTAKLIISSNPDLDEMMMAIRWAGDNGSVSLAILERGMVTDRQAIKINRTAGTMSGLTFSAMDISGRLATLMTDDPEVLDMLAAS